MTTETLRRPRRTAGAGRGSGAAVIGGAALGSLALGVLAAVVGALVDGAPAAYGALVGAVLAVAVMVFGSSTVNVVAGLMPGASLLFALLTYALQLLVVLVALAALDGISGPGETLSRGWLAGTLIGTVLGWLVVQVVLASRARIPAFDLPDEDDRTGGEA
ncbi:hypothetical protein [Nocardioides marmotae]|uniref:hypothetical protein n=1 Tax=Nocardioides marmotae TaxID=2663857 RepID=UPI0012B64E05|nr:hypothetical protein [Nocardioides marmotae]MBC9733177.1 hypothetical protein [Nocardioides marmotae]MTB84289.1 hypothetical protein [Nocardioides marmotae]